MIQTRAVENTTELRKHALGYFDFYLWNHPSEYIDISEAFPDLRSGRRLQFF